MRIELQALRAKVRGFQAEGISFHHSISKSSGIKRHNLWHHKRLLGNYSRLHLIAYGLLRNVPYIMIETCSPFNKPDPKAVLEIIKAHVPYYEVSKWSLDRVTSLLEVPKDK